MKWTNIGHEFDPIGKNFKHHKMIYIYGAGEVGKVAYEELEFLNCVAGFIDNDKEKQKSGYLGKPVESVIEFSKNKKGKYIVIVAASLINSSIFINQLIREGYMEGIDCFLWNSFRNYYLPIYSVYAWDLLYFPSVSFLPTTHCNLKCKACLNFTTINKNKRNRDFQELIEDVDNYFRCIDFTGLFHICGGDPFLLYRKMLHSPQPIIISACTGAGA